MFGEDLQPAASPPPIQQGNLLKAVSPPASCAASASTTRLDLVRMLALFVIPRAPRSTEAIQTTHRPSSALALVLQAAQDKRTKGLARDPDGSPRRSFWAISGRGRE